jgi:hypothetical protein
MHSVIAATQLNEQSYWIIAAFGGVMAVYLFTRPKAKKRDPADAPIRFPLGKQREVEQQMSNLLVELSTMARQITGQLDTRATRLELLIKEADEKIAALEIASEKLQFTAENNKSTPLQEVVASDEAAALQTFPPEPPSLSLPAPATERRYAEIYDLADEGKRANEIARLLDRPTGEVELILALRPK